jgi:hypothetical protein
MSTNLPGVGSPEALRFAAEVIESYGAQYPSWLENKIVFAAKDLRRDAHSIERERAEKAKRDRVIDDLLNLVSASRTVGVQTVVDELLVRFDITPKFTHCDRGPCSQEYGHDGGCTA